MSEQIECVGGPRNGTSVSYRGDVYKVRKCDKANLFLDANDSQDDFKYKALDIYVYRYDQTQSKYIYQGVEK